MILAVAYDPEVAWKRAQDGKNHGEIDASIACAQIMLQAADLGLGTTYVGMFDPDQAAGGVSGDGGAGAHCLDSHRISGGGGHPARLHTTRIPLEEMVQTL